MFKNVIYVYKEIILSISPIFILPILRCKNVKCSFYKRERMFSKHYLNIFSPLWTAGLVPRSNPKQSDLILAARGITMKMAPFLMRIIKCRSKNMLLLWEHV